MDDPDRARLTSVRGDGNTGIASGVAVKRRRNQHFATAATLEQRGGFLVLESTQFALNEVKWAQR